ncbi:MAG: hypothetical protein HZC55_04855 [Verrucomicrobia bacterium]|nr:hypothetical protein [Verrucomicrobiota bacterium]
MIALAAGIVLACGLALAPLLGEAWAVVAAGLIALSPFGLHEVLFTWPKWIATAWLVAAFGLVHARRPALAGAAVGVGFLYHPLVLLWTPWLALWAAGRGEWRLRLVLRCWFAFAASAAILVLPWMIVGRLAPHLPEALLAGQGNFLRYWQLADSQLGTWAQWWHARWLNFANTFLPLHLWISEGSYHHFRLNSTHEPSGPLVKFGFLWWNTLPFGAGLGLWAIGLAALGRAGRRWRPAIGLLFAAPALLLIVYWGMDPLGLMRESGHPLLVAFVALTCAVAAKGGGRLARVLSHRAFPWLQLPETLLMLWLTTLLNPRPWAVLHPDLDRAALAVNLLCLAGAAWLLARHRATLAPEPASHAAVCSRLDRLIPVALILAVALGCCAATIPGRAITPAFPGLAAQTEGTFPRDGQYAGEPFERASGVRLWGSWSGSDENTGTLTLGPFPAPAVLRLALGGYFSVAGNALALERTDTGARHPLAVAADIGERWRVQDFPVPADWLGRPVRLVARDQARTIGGWLAISEPLQGGRGKGSTSLAESIASWLVSGLLYFFPWLVALLELQRRGWLPPVWRPLGAAGAVALLGYCAFWAFWLHPVLGQAFSSLVLGGAILLWWRRPADSPALDPEALATLRLLGLFGLFSLAWLHLYPTTTDYHTLAAQRFRPMPGDNTLPHNLAADLQAGRPLRTPHADWLSSDRPPLQAGWLLLTRPVTSWLSLDDRTASGTAAWWCEGLWIFAAFGLLRTLGLRRPRALAWTALLVFTGFFLLNTIFTWPKLSAAAFVTTAVVLVLTSAGRPPDRPVVLAAGLCAGLAWLAHGGVAFSLLAAAPLLALAGGRCWRSWLPAAVVFAALVLPWLAYQKFYDPPGHRLIKWHLAGQVEKDPRGAWQTLRESYGALTAPQILKHKVRNLQYQVGGDWRWWLDGSRAGVKGRREDEFFLTGRALTWWVLGLLALPFALARSRAAPWRLQAVFVVWTLATLAVWCGLMFTGGSAVVHQGSYAVMLVLFTLLSAWAELASPWTLAVVAVAQGFTFATTWVTGTPLIGNTPDPVAAGLAAVAVIGLAALVVREHRIASTPPKTSDPLRDR